MPMTERCGSVERDRPRVLSRMLRRRERAGEGECLEAGASLRARVRAKVGAPRHEYKEEAPLGRWTAGSPLGALLAHMREEGVRRAVSSSSEGGPRRSAESLRHPPGLPEPDLHLETSAVSAPSDSHWRRKTGLLLVSVPLHASLLCGVIVVPLLMSEVFPSPTAATRAFFVEPIQAPPPPPPPPAPRAATSPPTAPRPRPSETATFTAPVETPDQIAPELTSDLG